MKPGAESMGDGVRGVGETGRDSFPEQRDLTNPIGTGRQLGTSFFPAFCSISPEDILGI
jgi:hypothetical protein